MVSLVALVISVVTASPGRAASLPDVIDALKPSVVVVGVYNATANPRFQLKGAGFVVGDGTLVITNAHVVEPSPQEPAGNSLVVQLWVSKTERQARPATVVELDRNHDLALLRIEGAPARPATLGDSGRAREGQAVAFMGFPIGSVLGMAPVTHRATISSITPIALPPANAQQLDERTISRLREGTFDIFQLDGTAYPGNSGGPLFDAETGAVLGVVNMVFVKATKESVLSQPSGISYAIPAAYVQRLIQQRRKPN